MDRVRGTRGQRVEALRWGAIGANVVYCVLVLAGAAVSRGAAALWPVALLLAISAVGLLALFDVRSRGFRRVASWISLVCGLAGAGALLFVLMVVPESPGSRKPVFLAAVTLMAAVPLFTAFALGRLLRSP